MHNTIEYVKHCKCHGDIILESEAKAVKHIFLHIKRNLILNVRNLILNVRKANVLHNFMQTDWTQASHPLECSLFSTQTVFHSLTQSKTGRFQASEQQTTLIDFFCKNYPVFRVYQILRCDFSIELSQQRFWSEILPLTVVLDKAISRT